MINKLVSLARTVLLQLKCGKQVHFSGLISVPRNVTLKVNGGMVNMGKRITLKSGDYFSVLNGGSVTIQDDVYFGRNCTIVCHDSVVIERGCAFGPNVMIYDHDHRFNGSGLTEGFRTAPIRIGKNSWIGAGVIILRGTTIGEGSVIGAGTVVQGTIPPFSLVTADRGLNITSLRGRD